MTHDSDGGVLQAALAVGLLQLFNWKPRTVGFLGVVASAINCYTLFPAVQYITKAPQLKAPVPGNAHDKNSHPEQKFELKKA